MSNDYSWIGGDKMLTKQQQQQVEASLKSKGAWKPCLRCGHNKVFIDGYFHHEVQDTDNPATSTKRASYPTVALICQNCGQMDFFPIRAVLPNES